MGITVVSMEVAREQDRVPVPKTPHAEVGGGDSSPEEGDQAVGTINSKRGALSFSPS